MPEVRARLPAMDPRKLAIATAGFSTFITLYSPQALLPALSREFGVGAAQISAIMTASTFAIALAAPFTGAVADVLGRKRVIAAAMLAVVIPMAGAALAQDAQALGVPFHGLFLDADLATRIGRVGSRSRDASDADADVARAQASYDLGALGWARVDASGTPEETLGRARAALGR